MKNEKLKIMKTKIILIACLAVILGRVDTDAKKAVLIAHYGSSDCDTRSKTIDRITADIANALPGYEVRETYISPVVRKRLIKAGETIESPTEALLRLHADGYDTVYVQSTTLIDGAEMAEVRNACDETAHIFRLLKCGEPLCFSPDDCEELVAVLAEEPRANDEAVVYVGHGNMLPSTATYSQLDYMFAANDHEGYHVSTIEGYPTAESTINELKRDGKRVKRAKLVPLLLVCGNHTKNDIAGEYAEALNKAGYHTEVIMRGLAETPAIRTLYVKKTLKMIERD